MKAFAGELLDSRTEIELGNAAQVGFTIRGEKIQYNALRHIYPASKNLLRFLQLTTELPCRFSLTAPRLKVSAMMVACRCSCFLPDLENTNIAMYATGGEAKIISLDVYELRSA